MLAGIFFMSRQGDDLHMQPRLGIPVAKTDW